MPSSPPSRTSWRSASRLGGAEEEALEDEVEDAPVLGRLGERGGERGAEVAGLGPRHLFERGERVVELGRPDRDALGAQRLAQLQDPRVEGHAVAPSRTPTRSATVSRSVRCLTMIDIVSRKTSWSMSSAPSRSSARAQSIDSAIDGGFLRSSSRTWWTTSTSLRATRSSSSGACRRTISSSCSVLGVVEPQVQAAALERLGQLARVVRGQQHDGVRAGLDPAELGDRDLEVRQQLEQHRLELLVGLVDLVDQEHDRLVGRDRGQQRAGEQELLAEDVVLDGVPAGAVGLGLDPQQLLAVVPLVQRLGLVEALVALQAHERAAEVAAQRLGELGLADAGRALDEHGLAEPGGEVAHQRGRVAGQVAGGPQAGGDVVDRCGKGAHRAWESRWTVRSRSCPRRSRAACRFEPSARPCRRSGS